MDDYLPALKKSIKSGKIGQAKTLLTQISSRSDIEKQEVIQILALASDKPAFELLNLLASQEHKDPEIYDRLIQLITDRAHLNFRFVLILFEIADRSAINQVAPLIKHILSKETDKELLNKIIRSSGKMKIEKLVNDIAEFIFYDDIVLKQEAVKALERIGTQKACEKLALASKTEKCDQNILDALHILQSQTSNLEEASTGPEDISDDKPAGLEDLDSRDFEKRFQAFIISSENPSTISSFLSE